MTTRTTRTTTTMSRLGAYEMSPETTTTAPPAPMGFGAALPPRAHGFPGAPWVQECGFNRPCRRRCRRRSRRRRRRRRRRWYPP
eukprot:893535-Pyramimonas_sp.AAC.1